MTNAAIIADSSPLISLAIVEQLELLPQLYQQVLASPAVWDEVTVQGAGLPGAQVVRQLTWLTIQAPEPKMLEPLSILIDRGEAEAIALAQSIPDSTVLLDDAQARRVAERLGVRPFLTPYSSGKLSGSTPSDQSPELLVETPRRLWIALDRI